MSELGSVTPNVSAPKSEAEREILEVQKHYYLFISTVLATNLTSVFTTPAREFQVEKIKLKKSSWNQDGCWNFVEVLPDVLKSVLIGCTEYRDLSVRFSTWNIKLNIQVECHTHLGFQLETDLKNRSWSSVTTFWTNWWKATEVIFNFSSTWKINLKSTWKS